MQYSILRLPSVLARRGVSRSKHYLDIARGVWTPPVQLGARAVGWPAHECDALVAALIAGKSDDDIRTLVAELIDSRKLAA